MKKLLPHFLLFIFALSFLGCSVTKRRYSPGYCVSWHHKAPDSKQVTQTKPTSLKSNRIIQPTTSFTETEIVQQKENNSLKKIIGANIRPHYLREVVDNISKKPIPNSLVWTYTITPENTIPGHNQPKDGSNRSDIRKAWLFLLFGFIGVIIIDVIILNNDNSSSARLNLLDLIPFIAIAISLIHCYKALQEGHFWGVFPCALLDFLYVFVLFLFILGAFIS